MVPFSTQIKLQSDYFLYFSSGVDVMPFTDPTVYVQSDSTGAVILSDICLPAGSSGSDRITATRRGEQPSKVNRSSPSTSNKAHLAEIAGQRVSPSAGSPCSRAPRSSRRAGRRRRAAAMGPGRCPPPAPPAEQVPPPPSPPRCSRLGDRSALPSAWVTF